MQPTDLLTAAGSTLSAVLATYATGSPVAGLLLGAGMAYPVRTAARETAALVAPRWTAARERLTRWLLAGATTAAEPTPEPVGPPAPLAGVLVDVVPSRRRPAVARRLPPLPVARRAVRSVRPAARRLPAPVAVRLGAVASLDEAEMPTIKPSLTVAATELTIRESRLVAAPWWDTYRPLPLVAGAAALAAFDRQRGNSSATPNGSTAAPELPSTAPTAKAEPEYAPGRVYSLDSVRLVPDPVRFQFKVDGVRNGVTAELASVRQWNPLLAGVLLVWRDPATGVIHPVNGHHRHELRTRTGGGPLNVIFSAATTAEEARAEGALANLAEGRGTALDCARWLRDTGRTPADLEAAGVSLAGRLVADGAALASLGEPLWRRVLDGRTVPAEAVIIGRHLADPERQLSLAVRADERDAAGQPWCGRQLEAAARKLAAAGTATVTTADLFGETAEEVSTWEQEVEVEAFVASQLRREASDFRAVSSERRAERVAGAGNVLATDANRERAATAAATLDTFARLVHLRGPVSAAVRESAATLATVRTDRDRRAVLTAALSDVRAALAN